MIDLRSDTMTKPSPAMREAMARAEVGDDVFREDPTIRQLEEETAAVLGQEAALFVTSGTMANQLAVMAQARSGDEIWAHEACHVVDGEQGGAAVLARVQIRTFRGDGGILDPDELRRWLRDPTDPHTAPRRLICLENTMGYLAGRVFPPARTLEIADFAQEHDLSMHLDGARLWNAAVALGIPPAVLAEGFDSVAVCYSKGLGAPVGSAVVGDRALVERARRARKLLGGGMRQAGIIAAGALHALRHNVERLADDHRRARRLAEGLADIRAITVEPALVETNMVFAEAPARAAAVVQKLGDTGVACLALDDDTVRLVTHLGIDDEDIERAISLSRAALG